MQGVIIAGGHATRIKGVPPPKCLIVIRKDGLTLLDNLLDQFAGIGIAKPLLVFGNRYIGKLLDRLDTTRCELRIDDKMVGTLPALGLLARELRDKEVLVTTGDAYFKQLKRVIVEIDEGTVQSFVGPPTKDRFQILFENDRVIYAGTRMTNKTVSSASLWHVAWCPAFWDSVQKGLGLGMTGLSQSVLFMPKGTVQLIPVAGEWGHVNTSEDLEEVRRLAGGSDENMETQ